MMTAGPDALLRSQRMHRQELALLSALQRIANSDPDFSKHEVSLPLAAIASEAGYTGKHRRKTAYRALFGRPEEADRPGYAGLVARGMVRVLAAPDFQSWQPYRLQVLAGFADEGTGLTPEARSGGTGLTPEARMPAEPPQTGLTPEAPGPHPRGPRASPPRPQGLERTTTDKTKHGDGDYQSALAAMRAECPGLNDTRKVRAGVQVLVALHGPDAPVRLARLAERARGNGQRSPAALLASWLGDPDKATAALAADRQAARDDFPRGCPSCGSGHAPFDDCEDTTGWHEEHDRRMEAASR